MKKTLKAASFAMAAAIAFSLSFPAMPAVTAYGDDTVSVAAQTETPAENADSKNETDIPKEEKAPETKPEVKPEPKPEVKPEPKPEDNPDAGIMTPNLTPKDYEDMEPGEIVPPAPVVPEEPEEIVPPAPQKPEKPEKPVRPSRPSRDEESHDLYERLLDMLLDKLVDRGVSFEPGFVTGAATLEERPSFYSEAPVQTDARYTVTRVYTSENSNSSRYDINDFNSKSDATIRQAYFADIILKITGTGAENVEVPAYSEDLLEMGSFVIKKPQSKINVINYDTNYAEVEIKGMQYTGNGKNLFIKLNNIAPISLDIGECRTRQEADSQSHDDDKHMASERPRVIISDYSYGGGPVLAGDTFNLSFKVTNTSDSMEVTNMLIKLSMPSNFMLTSSSNTIYVSDIPEGGTITKSVKVTAKPGASTESQSIDLSMSYQYVDAGAGNRVDGQDSESISIPIKQIDRFELTSVEIPTETYVGEEIPVTVNYVNKGRSEVYNISAEISGNIQNPGQKQEMGNLSSGTKSSADFYVTPEGEGICSGEIKITYEDTNFEVKEKTILYSTNVITAPEPSFPDMFPGGMGMPEPEPEPKSKMPYVIGGIAVAAVIAGIVIKKKIDKKRREEEDADL